MSEQSNLTSIEVPAFLMNVPFSLSSVVPNNAWMEEMTDSERRIDKDKAVRQFCGLYQHVAKEAIVYLLPGQDGLQDQTYVTNLGVVLPHRDYSTAVVSSFRAEARSGEAPLGRNFLELMGYETCTAPEFFEGEADLKYLRDSVYVGAFGIRTSRNALSWFEDRFGMNVIPFEIKDPYLYHLDCCVCPISPDNCMVCVEVADSAAIKAIENVTNIIDVSIDDAYSGITNCVVLNGKLLCASHVEELSRHHEHYDYEKSKIASLEKICSTYGLMPALFNLSEFIKSGAMLSCLFMHLNYANLRQNRRQSGTVALEHQIGA